MGVQGGLGGPGCLGGSRGWSRGVQKFWGASRRRLKHEKIRKTFRSCMARLLSSYIQDFVQQVPVGQMGGKGEG